MSVAGHGGAYYHPPAAYYPGYHPPTTVNYYGAGCYNCGGWSTAGAAAAGAAVGVVARRHSLGQYRGHGQRLQRRCRCRQRYCHDVCDGGDLRDAAGRLRHAQCARHDVLPVRQYVVPAVLWCKQRVLPGGADALRRLAARGERAATLDVCFVSPVLVGAGFVPAQPPATTRVAPTLD